MITGPEAIARIETTFPQLSADMHDGIAEGLLHLQIAEFARLVQAFVDRHQAESFDLACALFIELLDRGSPDLVNALYVSFLENITSRSVKRVAAGLTIACRRRCERLIKRWKNITDESMTVNQLIHRST